MSMPNDPTVQPLREGLPNTSDAACKAFLVRVLLSGLAEEDEDDCAFVLGSDGLFDRYCAFAGFDPTTTFRMKLMFALRLIDRRRLVDKTFHSHRFHTADKTRCAAAETESWPRTAVLLGR